MAALFGGKKYQTNWRWDGQDFSRGRQLSSRWIDAELHDGVAVLVFREQKVSGRIDRKMARLFSTGGDVFHQSELAGLGIDSVDDDGILAAIGGVKKFAGGMKFDFGGVVAAGKTRGKHRNILNGLKLVWSAAREDRHRRFQLAQDVHELAIF